MSAATRYQAVREALIELGPLSTLDEVATYVKHHHGYEFKDPRALSVYVAMVKKKMSRKESPWPSGMFILGTQ
jgi:hypothetical protein